MFIKRHSPAKNFPTFITVLEFLPRMSFLTHMKVRSVRRLFLIGYMYKVSSLPHEFSYVYKG